MVDNQHKLIKGYRDLSQDEINWINEAKEQEAALLEAFTILEKDDRINKRSLAIAKNHFQTGYMWFIRSIARPNGE